MKNSKSFWGQIFSSPISLILVMILLFIVARAAWNMKKSASSVSTKLAQTNSELIKLEQEKAELSARISSLSSPAGIESELRTKYRAVKEGESVAVIVDSNSTATPDLENASVGEKSLWSKFLGFFGL
jgi:cell division protein FtsB